MSNKRLIDFLQKEDKPVQGRRVLTAAVISDSKSKYLQNYIGPTNQHIKWWHKSGDDIQHRLRWLKNNIDIKIQQYGNIHFYIWLGTCNLTKREKKGQISIANTNTQEAVQEIAELYANFTQLVKKHPGCKLTFLEVPHYSIVRWNTSKGHKNPELFTEQDITLRQQVEELNLKIHSLNSELGVHSPLLTVHLRTRKQVKRGKNKPTKDVIKYSLLSDGIHPSPLLSRVWLREIVDQVKVDCYQ
ncbi:unnamed protein product [Mytilus edulis]|uniref:Uncharacterized protein n=1 Tax=Mytilus edulis TaxID=6550 RepID=A0A8S3RE31_MYTED|nr:unnamed protein product [Mytilus edulis]